MQRVAASIKVLEWQKRLCSIFSCIILFSVVALICLSVGVLCCILFQSEMNSKTPLLITSDATYASSTSETLLACVYPARDFTTTTTDHECTNFPTFFCPVNYQCNNVSNSNVPVCYSETMSCSNNTFCYEYINGLSYTSDELAKELDLTYKQGWVVFFYLITLTVILFFIVAIPVAIVFRNKVNWDHNDSEQSLVDSSKGPNLKYYDSYSHILGDENEEDDVPWTSREIIIASSLGGTGAIVIFCILVAVSTLTATMEPSMPTIDEIVEYNCLSSASLLNGIRWRVSTLLVFTIMGECCLLSVTLLLMASQIKRIYVSLWNAKACCYLWGIITALVIAIGVLAIVVAAA